MQWQPPEVAATAGFKIKIKATDPPSSGDQQICEMFATSGLSALCVARICQKYVPTGF